MSGGRRPSRPATPAAKGRPPDEASQGPRTLPRALSLDIGGLERVGEAGGPVRAVPPDALGRSPAHPSSSICCLRKAGEFIYVLAKERSELRKRRSRREW